jgi:protein-disulfide isomerase
VPLAQDRNALLRPGAGDAQASRLTLDQLGWDEGEVDAPVRVVEFSDFGCGYCRTFHLETYPTLMEEYVATGKVLWKYVPMVLGNFGPNATAAALAAECAGEQGYFPAARDSLFATQGEWKQASDPADLFRRIAGNVGADLERWDRCLEEGWQENRVVSGTTLSREVGARGTPTFFIVGYPPIPGAIPLELFQEVLDTVYAVSQREGDGG